VPLSQFNRTLEAAVGFFELGMPEEALRELDSLPPADQGEEEVLELRLVLFQHLGRWDDASQACSRLCQHKGADVDRFIAWGCCLYELARVEECRRVLLQAPPEARGNGLWNFHLACYEALAGHGEAARKRVQLAIRLDPCLRHMAQQNSNLAPMLKPVS